MFLKIFEAQKAFPHKKELILQKAKMNSTQKRDYSTEKQINSTQKRSISTQKRIN